MQNRLVIIGAGGHGKVVADIALKQGYQEIVFLDDHIQGTCMGFPILGHSSLVEKLQDAHTDFVIGIGDNESREEVAQKYNIEWATLIHPSAQIGLYVSIGVGSVIMAGAIVNADTKIGACCIVNSGAVVEHENVLEDFVHISPGAVLAGTVHVGKGTHIGVGATVKNNVTICGGCTIGAGAVVVKDIEEEGTYVGVPASLLVKKR